MVGQVAGQVVGQMAADWGTAGLAVLTFCKISS